MARDSIQQALGNAISRRPPFHGVGHAAAAAGGHDDPPAPGKEGEKFPAYVQLGGGVGVDGLFDERPIVTVQRLVFFPQYGRVVDQHIQLAKLCPYFFNRLVYAFTVGNI